MEEQIGVIIKSGLQNWQILQQKEGTAGFRLSGLWRLPVTIQGNGRVFARVVREDSGDTVLPWAECKTCPDGRWSAEISGLAAGGLYRVETCLHAGEVIAMEWGVRGDMIHHVGVGDLFVITGQSNSAGYGKDPTYDPPELGIHILRNSNRWDLAAHPLNDSTDTAHAINREMANPGHSPYLSFSRQLKKELGYPIGLLQAALGGSLLSQWNPQEDGALYNNMMATIREQNGIRGILWYQGCEDAKPGLCDTYLCRFEAMVKQMRKDIGNDNLPFLTVQLNRYTRYLNDEQDICWSKIREAQRQAAHKIPNVFIIPSVDSNISDAVHNAACSNMVLGERLAKMALNKIYRKKYICDAPDLERAWFQDDGRTLNLDFAHVCSRLYFYEMLPSELPFTVEDAKGTLPVESFRVEKGKVILSLERQAEESCRIHCAYGRNPMSRMPVDYDGHLPILPFYGIAPEKNNG